MPATPKPPGTRRRRNVDQGRWRKLSADPGIEIPKAPSGLSSAGRRWWREVWSSPMAAVFLPVDRLALERGARLVSLLELELGDAKLLTELRHVEDRFGLSPLARRRLQWEIEQAPPRDPAAHPRRPRRDTRLHAV